MIEVKTGHKTKYFKNQKPPSNIEAKFTDEYFPANTSSILLKEYIEGKLTKERMDFAKKK